jgi:hypothetical protein
MRRQSATPLTCEQRQIGVLETETSVPLVLWCPRYPVIAQTMAEIMAKIDLRDLDIDPKVPARKGYAHLNCSSTNHFLLLREQFVEPPDACGGWPAGWGKVQWPGPPQ